MTPKESAYEEVQKDMLRYKQKPFDEVMEYVEMFCDNGFQIKERLFSDNAMKAKLVKGNIYIELFAKES